MVVIPAADLVAVKVDQALVVTLEVLALAAQVVAVVLTLAVERIHNLVLVKALVVLVMDKVQAKALVKV